ncbi:MAG: M23 family metallopeptidase, partial [Gemmatimonadota bacterium]
IDPGVETIMRRTVPARSAILIYNPFHTFAADLPLGRLRYAFTFAGREGGMTTAVEVDPIQYRQAVSLRLPLAGRILVYDGHDFYAHHRRVNTEHPLFKQAGFTTNPERYGHDLSLVDGAGRMYRGDGKRNEDWLSWGAPILAPAAGRIVAVENGMPDYDVGTPGGGIPLDSLLVRPASLMGNYVIVDHGGGMFSRMLHMQRGSVLVRVGQRVVQGQPVGKVGFSGSVSTVHLHYEIGSGPAIDSEGLPAYFTGFRRVVGSTSRVEASGPINSGDIVER